MNVSISEIVNSFLLGRYPLHWYIQATKYAVECVKELHYDILAPINSRKITINDRRAIELPCDFMKLVRIGRQNSDGIMPAASSQTINRLIELDANGKQVPYPSDNWMLGQHTGDWVWSYEHYQPKTYNEYAIITERNEIQLHNFCGDFVILDYITDGTELDNASKIHPFAQAAIKQYIQWKFKNDNRSYSKGEVQAEKAEYEQQERKLRGRLSDVTIAGVLASMYSGYGKAK